MAIVEQAHQLYEVGVPYQVPLFDQSLFTLLDEAADLYPNRVAIDYFGATITYKEVRSQAKKAAQVLVDSGVKSGDTVAIVLPNCPQAFVAFYACMRIGAIAAEHNPLAPATELEGQFGRHQAKVAIVWEKSIDSCPIDGYTGLETVFSVDISAGMPRTQRVLLGLPVSAAKEKRSQLRSEVPAGIISWDKKVNKADALSEEYPHAKGTDKAVILHTGGTNGVPKSVPLTHKNIGTNVNQCMFWVFKLHEGAEVFFSLLPYFHAFGLTFFLCAAVRKAATQVVLPKFDVPMSLAAHKRRSVTFFVGVPPMFERIAKGAKESGIDITSIRYAVAGAMPLSEKVAKLWEEVAGGIILEGYGLSETSPVLCGSPLTSERRLGTLGLPFPSTQLRLVRLDDPSIDVEDGEPGEIIVKGPQVFEGYLDSPEENRKAFTEDGWFRTGDIGVNHNGYIDMADRKKELVLSGGFNVYPSQVEEVLRMMPGVKDVAVVGMPTADNREEVTAALILEDGAQNITIEQLRDWADKKLAHYAIPRQVAFIPEIPRNQIGKVMRRAVKEQLLDPASKLWSNTTKAVSPVLDQVGPLAESLSQKVGDLVTGATDTLREALPGNNVSDEKSSTDPNIDSSEQKLETDIKGKTDEQTGTTE